MVVVVRLHLQQLALVVLAVAVVVLVLLVEPEILHRQLLHKVTPAVQMRRVQTMAAAAAAALVQSAEQDQAEQQVLEEQAQHLRSLVHLSLMQVVVVALDFQMLVLVEQAAVAQVEYTDRQMVLAAHHSLDQAVVVVEIRPAAPAITQVQVVQV